MRLILDETVLYRRVGGPLVMREQFDQLIRVSARPNLTIQVIPLGAGAHAAVDGSFVLMGFPEREPHVYIESRRGALILEDSMRTIYELREALDDE